MGRVNLQWRRSGWSKLAAIPPRVCVCLFVYQVLANVMESEQQEPSGRDAAPKQWRSCKLIIDPSLTNGLYKVYRYDGQHFNIPVSIFQMSVLIQALRSHMFCSTSTSTAVCFAPQQVADLGVFPVAAVRDPRVCRLWSRCDSTDLVVPRFKVWSSAT